MEGKASYEQLCERQARVEGLCRYHLAALHPFHFLRESKNLTQLASENIQIGTFDHLLSEGGPAKRDDEEPRHVSISSTCTCLRSLLANPEARTESAAFLPVVKALQQKAESEGLKSQQLPPGNPYTVGQLLSLLDEESVPAELRDGVIKAVSVAPSAPGDVAESAKASGLDQLKAAVTSAGVRIGELTHAGEKEQEPEREFPPNGYLTYWSVVGLERAGEDFATLAANSIEWSAQELYRQISYFAADDDEQSDPFQLGYNLLIQYRHNRSGLRHSVIDEALRQLFAAQTEAGSWPKKGPLFVYGKSGNAYPFGYELLTSLLKEFAAAPEFLARHDAGLARAVDWADGNAITISTTPDISVWRSGHVASDTRPESWATAEVYSFLQRYLHHLRGRIQRLVLEEFHASPRTPPSDSFSAFYLPDVELKGNQHPETLDIKSLLKGRLLEPLRVSSDPLRFSLAEQRNAADLNRSGIFFGPPGTGKTSYARAIAQYLGWPFLVLNPADFAEEGLHLIPTRATRIFDRLMQLSDAVVLFDEMEELMRRRKGQDGSFEQRFLTTSLLPLLQDLATQARCVFIVATNHFGELDDAATRQGRFDFSIAVMPPSPTEKVRMAEDVFRDIDDDDFKKVKELILSTDNIKLATRNEMKMLLADVHDRPSEATSILSGFRPALLSDTYKEALRKDWSGDNNVFEKRVAGSGS